MNTNNILEYLRSRSHKTKSLMIAAGGAVAVLAMGSIWINSVQSQLGGLTETEEEGEIAGIEVTTGNRISIESAQAKDGKTEFYFKVHNETPDIMVFSPNDQITLRLGDNEVNPEKVLDRQGGDFVKKVLSGSTAYGILVFPQQDSRIGSIYFDDIFFEQNKGTILKEVINVNLEDLGPAVKLRS